MQPDRQSDNPLLAAVHHGVSFRSGSAASVAGVLGGVALAMGVPWVILSYGGQLLAPGVVTFLVITAVVVGGLMGLTGVFFGIVMPSQVNPGWDGPARPSGVPPTP